MLEDEKSISLSECNFGDISVVGFTVVVSFFFNYYSCFRDDSGDIEFSI